VCRPPYSEESRFSRYTLKPLLRFFTLGFVSTGLGTQTEWEHGPVLKRIIGLPGDTVKIENNKVYIKEAGASSYTVEPIIITKDYLRTEIDEGGDWPSIFPLGGAMQPLTLSENEYFVLGDNRPVSLDSRHWGLIRLEDIEGLVFLRYWPFRTFDTL
jgi:signal peptidase I